MKKAKEIIIYDAINRINDKRNQKIVVNYDSSKNGILDKYLIRDNNINDDKFSTVKDNLKNNFIEEGKNNDSDNNNLNNNLDNNDKKEINN